jgi:hypothetical protein
MNNNEHLSIEIFGPPGVGKSTFIRVSGLQSSQELYEKELDRFIKIEFKKKIYLPIPSKIAKMFRSVFQYRYDEVAFREFSSYYKEFLDLCLYVIFTSPVSAERKVRCYKLLLSAIVSWWILDDREGIVWDESFAKVVLYACGMDPGYSDKYFANIVKFIPKRSKYIFLDGTPEQGVIGQVNRGKYNNHLSLKEREEKLRSAEKYRKVAERLYTELVKNGCMVEIQRSTIVV